MCKGGGGRAGGIREVEEVGPIEDEAGERKAGLAAVH